MDYRKKITEYNKIVVKIGTTSLTYSNGSFNLNKMDKLARVLTDIRNRGIDIVLVSSGAIAVGAKKLGLKERPRDIIGKQASSAVGQALLMQMYEKFFGEYNQKIAQILTTMPVLDSDQGKVNTKNTFDKLFELNVIPIVNENDTVATDEFNEFSDNDTLSAHVASLINSDMLIILSDIDGMYTADPNKNKDASKISIVEKITDDIYSLAGGSASSLGTGGMATKVKAADFLSQNGIDMIIASGDNPSIIYDIIDGKDVGTLFIGKNNG